MGYGPLPLQKEHNGCTFVHMSHPLHSFGFYKLEAWRESHKFTLMIYEATTNFPEHERYGVTNQVRRASSSIGAQIAEGSRMSTMVHRKLYYDRAYASGAEVANFLELAHDLHYIIDNKYLELMEQCNCVCALVFKLSRACLSITTHA